MSSRPECLKKVVHISTVHRPFDVRIFYKQAKTLANAGYDVIIIGQGEAKQVDGVRLIPLPVPKNRLARMTITAWQAFRYALAEGASIYHFHDPELIPVGLLLKLFGARVIYDVHEDVVRDIYDKRYIPGWLKPPLRVCVACMELIAAKAFDRIVCATDAIYRRFSPNATLVRNVPVLEELSSPDSRPFSMRSRRVIYVGGLAPFNGVESMIRAMGKIPASENIRLTLGGEFLTQADEQAARALPGWERVDYVGWVDRTILPDLLADSVAGLVVYQPTPNIMSCEPNKFFEVLSAGLPLIASDLPHWKNFLERHGCGLIVNPSDPDAIAKAIVSLVNDPERAEQLGRRGRAIIEDNYHWAIDANRLLALYRDLLRKSGTKTPRVMKSLRLIGRDFLFYFLGYADVGSADWRRDPWLYPLDWTYQLDRSHDYFSPVDAAGIPMKNLPGSSSPQYLPSRVAGYALANWHYWRTMQSTTHLERFLAAADWFASSRDGRFLHYFPVPGLDIPWLSCIAQGEAGSVLARAFLLTEKREYLVAARAAMLPLLKSVHLGGLQDQLPTGELFLEEYPGSPYRHVLNGCLYAMVGIHDVLRVLPEDWPELSDLLDTLRQTISNNLSAWNVNGWSSYDYPRQKGLRNLNTLTYHLVHVLLLNYIAESYDMKCLKAMAVRWERSARSLPHRFYALGKKISYRLSRGW